MALVCPSCGDVTDAGAFCPKDGARLSDQNELQSRVGQTVADRYRLLRKVGQGAVGEVYEAEHIHIHKKVALKLLRSEVASDATVVQRFQREARATSAIGHSNIVQIEDFGIAADGSVFLAMEWLEGETLESLLQRETLDQSTALCIACAICSGLAAAHEAGVIHRDLKPANVIVNPGKQAYGVKVLDFGIAKLSSSSSDLTSVGTFLGTPNYMAPEQASDTELDGRADVYSLGVVLYEMFTGQLPFSAATPVGVLHQHAHAIVVPPAEVARSGGVQVSPEINALIMRCLEKQPGDRYQSASALGEALAAISRGTGSVARSPEPPQRPEPYESQGFEEFQQKRSPWLYVIILALVFGGGGGIYMLLASDATETATLADDATTTSGNQMTDASSAKAIDEPATDANSLLPAARHDAGHHASRDAGESTTPDAGPTLPSWTYRWKDGRGVYSAIVSPGHAKPGSSVQIELKIPLDANTKNAIALVSFSHYRDHAAAGNLQSPIDKAGSVIFLRTFPKAGKYHVTLRVLEGEVESLKTRFDICIGADPATRSRELSKTCPRMNGDRPDKHGH